MVHQKQEDIMSSKNLLSLLGLKASKIVKESDKKGNMRDYTSVEQLVVEVQAKLKENGIPTAVHYPMSLHLQECFKYLGYSEGDFPIAEQINKEIMSLPMNPYLNNNEIKYIIKEVTNVQ